MSNHTQMWSGLSHNLKAHDTLLYILGCPCQDVPSLVILNTAIKSSADTVVLRNLDLNI